MCETRKIKLNFTVIYLLSTLGVVWGPGKPDEQEMHIQSYLDDLSQAEPLQNEREAALGAAADQGAIAGNVVTDATTVPGVPGAPSGVINGETEAPDAAPGAVSTESMADEVAPGEAEADGGAGTQPPEVAPEAAGPAQAPYAPGAAAVETAEAVPADVVASAEEPARDTAQSPQEAAAAEEVDAAQVAAAAAEESESGSQAPEPTPPQAPTPTKEEIIIVDEVQVRSDAPKKLLDLKGYRELKKSQEEKENGSSKKNKKSKNDQDRLFRDVSFVLYNPVAHGPNAQVFTDKKNKENENTSDEKQDEAVKNTDNKK